MKFYVADQTLRLDGIQPRVVSNSQDFVSCRFSFSTGWEGLVKVALFRQGDNTYTQVLDEAGCCMLPVEIVVGQCGISVYGADAGETTTATTNICTVNVVQAGYYGEAIVPTPDLYSQLLAEICEAETSAAENATTVAAMKERVEEMLIEILAAKEISEGALSAAETVSAAVEEAKVAEATATQALSDLLAMITGGTLAVLVNGKIPIENIPATATQEIYVISDESELVALVAQRGDLAELVEDIDGVPTITKTWQLLDDDATVAENWVIWGTSYAVQAGSATYATNAGDAYTINGKRIVAMTAEEYDVAVLDDDTFYLVTGL